MTTPSIRDVDEIARVSDPVLRNLRITQCYHELSAALSALTGPSANWCTFATWASKQAGQSIRKEDLHRAFEMLFRRSPEVAAAAEPLLRELGRMGLARSRTSLIDAVLQGLDPGTAIERTAAAVARGNLKVFEEIAREFARFLAEFAADTEFDAAKAERFCSALVQGESPDGQSRLRQAFTALCAARFERDERAKAEFAYLSNLLVGYHEQRRLQPEILEAMNAPFGDATTVKRRILTILVPGWWLRMRLHVGRLLNRELPLDRLIDRVIEIARLQLREVITRSLMSLQISDGEVVRLGRALLRESAPPLRSLEHPPLLTLLTEIGADPEVPVGTGTRDWASFEQRIRFIAALFRAYHLAEHLFDAPFTEEQVRVLRSGRVPAGRL
jgi:hypothetical protein